MEDFFKILWPSQNIWTLTYKKSLSQSLWIVALNAMIINLKVFNKVEITYVVWACYLPCLGSIHLFRHRKSSIFGVGTTSLVVFPFFQRWIICEREKEKKCHKYLRFFDKNCTSVARTLLFKINDRLIDVEGRNTHLIIMMDKNAVLAISCYSILVA